MNVNVVIIECHQENSVHEIVELVSKYTKRIAVVSEVGSEYHPIKTEIHIPTDASETGFDKYNMVHLRNKGFRALRQYDHDYTLFLDGDRVPEGDISFLFSDHTHDCMQVLFKNAVHYDQTEADTDPFIEKKYLDFYSAGFLLSKKLEDDLLNFHHDENIMNMFFAGRWGNEDRYLAAEIFHLGYKIYEINMNIVKLRSWDLIQKDFISSIKILPLLFKKNKIKLPFDFVY